MRRLPFRTKFWYGFGQLAEGIKNSGFNTFLFFYYVEVLGLAPSLAGAAVAIALVFDAVTDPLVGSISDRFRSRWGRRHPFMYASAIPLAITFYAVFAPPAGLESTALFVWLTVFAIAVRASMTLYHVPHLALGAELTDDFEERTSVVGFRSVFSLTGGVGTTLFGFFVFLAPTPEFPNGQLNPAGYSPLALAFAVVMLISVWASALGTHDTIPRLHQPTGPPERFRLRRVVTELGEALTLPDFRLLFVAGIIIFVMFGVQSTLSVHMGTFFWELATAQIGLNSASLFVGLVLGIPVWTLVSRRLGKAATLTTGVLWAAIFAAVPVLAKNAGFYPPHESPFYVPLVLAVSFLSAFGLAAGVVTAGSMMADLTDAHELRFGRRQEGIFFAASSFSAKAASGIGHGLAGIGLEWIRFPAGEAVPGEVAPDVVANLGVLYGPGVCVLALLATVLVSRYRLDARRHSQILSELAARRAREGDAR